MIDAPQQKETALPPIAPATMAAPKLVSVKLASTQAIAEVTTVKTQSVASSGDDIELIVRQAARNHGINEDHFVNIAMCESTLGPLKVNPEPVIIKGINYGHAKGLFQFLDETWIRIGTRAGNAGKSVFDPVANADTTAWAFAHGYQGEWACK